VRRWLRRIGFVTAIALLLAIASLGVFALTLPADDVSVIEPGLLVVTDDVAGEWKTGDLTVTLATDQLTVTERNRVVWQSPAGEAFLTAARGSYDVEEHRGYFWPQVHHERSWTEQRVAKAGPSDDGIRLSGVLSDEGRDLAWHATISPRPGGGALLDVEVRRADAVMLTSGRTDGAGVHGFGEQFDDFDLDGRLLPLLVREQGVGRGTQPLTLLADLTNDSAAGDATTTYAAMASFVTDDVRGVALAADEPASHAFAVADTREAGSVGLEVWSSTLSAELTAAETPAELVSERAVGAPTVPEWSQRGAIIGLQGGTLEVRRELGQLQSAGAEISAVWLQDWSGQRTTDFGDRLWWTWQLDRERYPGWEQLVADLDAQGIAVTTYVNPFLVDAARKGDDTIRNLYDEAEEAGYLVTKEGGSTYLLDQGGFDAALVDLSNPDARDWYADVIAEEVLGIGVSGFMADFGEGLPFDATIARGDPRQAHNEWPRLWARTVREACERTGEVDCLTWFRSGSLGMGEDASLFWNGDQLVDFGRSDGLASALLGTFSAGVSGMPLVHSDIGGYTSVGAVVTSYTRGDDLLERWAELQAFGVVMRTHEGNRPDDNAQVFDPEHSAAFARMTKVYAALEPYRAEVLAEATELGLPAVRHGWLVAPGTDAAEVDTQFFLGDALLVAPVLEGGADSVEVVFPPGEWLNLFTGRTYEEGTQEVDAPLGRPAAFVRADHPLAGQLVEDVQAAVGTG
jgi:alpha-glucosidase